MTLLKKVSAVCVTDLKGLFEAGYKYLIYKNIMINLDANAGLPIK